MSLHPDTPADEPLGDDIRRWMSAAADGQADALGKACQAWRDDPEARAHWHTVHLIGDVMRSTELATQPAHDAAFLGRLRERLAAEPVVLAPAPIAPKPVIAPRRPSAWMLPAAVAAGVFAVAGVLVVSQVSGPGSSDGARTLATAAPSITPVATPLAGPTLSQAQGDRTLLRDARLDEYLRAHQAARGGMAAAVPGNGLRRVDTELPAGVSR